LAQERELPVVSSHNTFFTRSAVRQFWGASHHSEKRRPHDKTKGAPDPVAHHTPNKSRNCAKKGQLPQNVFEKRTVEIGGKRRGTCFHDGNFEK